MPSPVLLAAVKTRNNECSPNSMITPRSVIVLMACVTIATAAPTAKVHPDSIVPEAPKMVEAQDEWGGTPAPTPPPTPVCDGKPKAKLICPNGDCGKIIPLPEETQFMESISTCPGCGYAYLQGSSCKGMATCKGDGSDTAMRTTIFKYTASTETIETFMKVTEPAVFVAFGSKLSKDGKYLFIASTPQNMVIVIDTQKKETVLIINNVLAPNDIAIWEDGNDITLYTGGGFEPYSPMEVPASGFTAVISAKVVTNGNLAACGKSCDYDKDFKSTKKTWMTTYESHTLAGIGLDTTVSPPNIWAAELDQFAWIPGNTNNEEKQKWDLTDHKWAGNFQCSLKALPDAAAPRHNKFSLVDNICMVDHKTMITAIYTDCSVATFSICMGMDASAAITGTKDSIAGRGMYTKATEYQAVSFAKTCIDKFDPTKMTLDGPNKLDDISDVYTYDLTNKPGFSGRITQIQSVGNDLVAVNYQADSVLLFKGAVPQLKCQ